MDMTGIFMSFKKSNKASKEPKVDACTVTPRPDLSTESNKPVKSSMTSSSMSSSSSSSPTTNNRDPATAFSKSFAAILTPRAAFTSLWCTYSDLIRNSRNGCGVNKARMFVAIGPFKPQITIRSPSLKIPLDKITSIVVPKPSTTFTSKTVASIFERYINCLLILFCVNSNNNQIKSGTPSPVTADVGTMDTYLDMFAFWKYNSELSPCSANANLTFSNRSWNSAWTARPCLAKESRNELFGVSFQSYNASILFKATINGAFLSRNNRIDSMVCCSKPCMMSITNTAMLHNDEPAERKLVNDSCPGVSMINNPGTSNVCFSYLAITAVFCLIASTGKGATAAGVAAGTAAAAGAALSDSFLSSIALPSSVALFAVASSVAPFAVLSVWSLAPAASVVSATGPAASSSSNAVSQSSTAGSSSSKAIFSQSSTISSAAAASSTTGAATGSGVASVLSSLARFFLAPYTTFLGLEAAAPFAPFSKAATVTLPAANNISRRLSCNFFSSFCFLVMNLPSAFNCSFLARSFSFLASLAASFSSSSAASSSSSSCSLLRSSSSSRRSCSSNCLRISICFFKAAMAEFGTPFFFFGAAFFSSWGSSAGAAASSGAASLSSSLSTGAGSPPAFLAAAASSSSFAASAAAFFFSAISFFRCFSSSFFSFSFSFLDFMIGPAFGLAFSSSSFCSFLLLDFLIADMKSSSVASVAAFDSSASAASAPSSVASAPATGISLSQSSSSHLLDFFTFFAIVSAVWPKVDAIGLLHFSSHSEKFFP